MGGMAQALQHSCLGNLRNIGAWWATVHGVTEWDTTEHTPGWPQLRSRLPYGPSLGFTNSSYALSSQHCPIAGCCLGQDKQATAPK